MRLDRDTLDSAGEVGKPPVLFLLFVVSGPVDRPLTANPSLFLRALEDGGDCRSFMEGTI